MLGGLVVIGFCLPLLIKNSGSLLELISTYVVPAVVGGLAVAYVPRPTRGPGAMDQGLEPAWAHGGTQEYGALDRPRLMDGLETSSEHRLDMPQLSWLLPRWPGFWSCPWASSQGHCFLALTEKAIGSKRPLLGCTTSLLCW